MTATTVLLVDDEPAITESLAYVLGRSGFDALTAGSLAEADRRLGEHPGIELVILDVMLPDGNGVEWLKGFRQRSSLPVIILSSHDDAIDHIVALEIGADDYIDKPFSAREVVARMRAVLRRFAPAGVPNGDAGLSAPTSGPPSSSTSTAALIVDLDRRLVLAHGRPVGLSKTEFDLLATLHAAPGRVFERDTLLDRVWGDTAVTERSVDAFVKSLRKKLADAGLPADTIETVRGVGYRLAERPGTAAGAGTGAGGT
ncbi:response regulator transcription factor [Myxococcota bacterium]|nr:response regulator transcription factor [Myxococcota bacterium]